MHTNTTPFTHNSSIAAACNDLKLFHNKHKLYYAKLPVDIEKKFVILMDAAVATGNSTQMAVHVLLDHGVPEGLTDHIFASYLFPHTCLFVCF